MKTNRVLNQQNPQFTAIRRVKCSMKEYNELLAKYKDKFEHSYVFKNNSVEHNLTMYEIANVATSQKASSDWVVANSKRHGIALPDYEQAPLLEFTDNDLLKVSFYTVKRIFGVLWHVLVKEGSARTQVPEHLVIVKLMTDYANKCSESFQKFLSKNKVEDFTLEEYVKFLEKTSK